MGSACHARPNFGWPSKTLTAWPQICHCWCQKLLLWTLHWRHVDEKQRCVLDTQISFDIMPYGWCVCWDTLASKKSLADLPSILQGYSLSDGCVFCWWPLPRIAAAIWACVNEPSSENLPTWRLGCCGRHTVHHPPRLVISGTLARHD